MKIAGFHISQAVTVDVPPPGRSKALWASEILSALHEIMNEYIGARVDDSIVHHVRNELSGILAYQASIRSISLPDSALRVSVEITEGGSLNFLLPTGWAEDLDRKFRNRACLTCGGLITHGTLHTLEECDLTLASAVIES